MKKILVSLPKDVVSLVDNQLIGKLGDGRSDVLRTVILDWLLDKGYFDPKIVRIDVDDATLNEIEAAEKRLQARGGKHA